MKRLLLAGTAVFALTFGATSCGSVDPSAVVVNGERTSARDFERTLTLLRKAGATTLGAESGTLPGTETRALLANVVVISVFHQEFRQRGLQVDPTDTATAEKLPAQIFAVDDAVWQKMPSDIKTQWNGLAAEYLAVRATLAGPPPSEEAVQAFYEANKDQVNGAALEEVRPQIEQALQTQASNAAASKLLDAAVVKVNPRYGAWDPAKGVVSLNEVGADATTTTAP